VHRLGGVDVERWDSGRSERGGQLLGDEARLADAGDDDVPRAVEDQLNDLDEALSQSLANAQHGTRLRLEHAARILDLLAGVPAVEPLNF